MFQENKYYVMTPPGTQWEDFEGPFENEEAAFDHIKIFINKNHNYSPEMLGMVVCYFNNATLDMVKRNGMPLNGNFALRCHNSGEKNGC